MKPTLLLVIVLCAAACNEDNNTHDAGTGDDLSAAPDLSTTHTPAPVITNHDGNTLSAVEVWTVVWPGDEATGAKLDAFHSALLKSSYWDLLSEYGLGHGTAKGVVVMSSPPPANFTAGDIDDFASTVAAQLGSQWNANSLAVLLIPYASTVDGGLDAFHNSTGLGANAYTMITQHNLRQRPNPFDDLTFIDSHELAEASTDPTGNGWFADGFDDITEVSDLCSEETATVSATVELGDASVPETYLVVRQYSEKAAAMENVNPCVPTPAGEPYFNAAIPPVTVTLDGQGNETGMATMQLFSYSGDPGALKWVVDVPYDHAHFTVAPYTGTAQVGDMVPIKFTSMGAMHYAHAGRVVVQDGSGVTNEWWFPVSVQ